VRIFLGSLVAAVALAAAAYMHSDARFATHWRISDRTNNGALLEVSSTAMPGQACNPHAGGWHDPYGPACTPVHFRTSWQNPVAIVIAVAGLGVGLGLVMRH
jgi:hypothetical protein